MNKGDFGYIDTKDFDELLKSYFFENVLKPILLAVGSFFSAKGLSLLCLALNYAIKMYVLPLFSDKYILRDKYGDYIVMTNPCDVLGAAFAKEFLRRGHSLIMIMAENDPRFKPLKPDFEQCKAEGGGEIIIINKIINQGDILIYQAIKDELKSVNATKKIGILMNNAGFAGNRPDNFLRYRDEYVLDCLHSNVVDFMMVTKACLEIMYENHVNYKRSGLVVNISSPESCELFVDSGFPRTMQQFSDEFNKIATREFSTMKGIKLEAIHPGCICTDDNQCESSRMNPTPEKFVESAITGIGKADVYSGYFYHSLRNFFRYCIPDFLYSFACYVNRKLKEDEQKKQTKSGYAAL